MGPAFINFVFFSRPHNLIRGPTFIKFWNFFPWATDIFKFSIFIQGPMFIRYHWRLSYTKVPKLASRFDNLDYFSYKNLKSPISLWLEMTSQRLAPYLGKCQKIHLFAGKNLVTLSQTDVFDVFINRILFSSIVPVAIWRVF